MIEIIRKNKYEFVCIFDDMGILQTVGKSITDVMQNVQSTRALAQCAMDMVARKYDFDIHNTECEINVFQRGENTGSNLVLVINTINTDSAAYDDEDEDDESASAYYSDTDVDDFDEDVGPDISQVAEYSDYIVYAFRDIEDVIQLQKHTSAFNICASRLFHFQSKYIVLVQGVEDLDPEVSADLCSLFAEYGHLVNNLTVEYLEEYAKFITDDVAGMVDILTNKGKNA